MSVLTGFCKQVVSHEHKLSGASRYADEVNYAPAAMIRARIEPASGTKRTATGDEVEAESIGLTEAVVGVGDLVCGQEVRRVEEIIAKSGRRLGCEFYL